MFGSTSSVRSWWKRDWDTNPRTATLPVLVLFLATFITLFCIRLRKKKQSTLLPPGPRGLPLLGYLPFLGHNLHLDFAKLAKTYGPIYKLFFGEKLFFIVSSPVIAKEVMRDQDLVFSNRDSVIAARIVSYGTRGIVFTDYGPYWREMRKIFVREMMSNSSLDSGYSLRKLEVRKSIRSLYDKAGTRTPVDIGEFALLLLLYSTMATLWGNTINYKAKAEFLGPEFRTLFAELVTVVARPNVSDFFPFLASFDLQGIAKEAKRIHRRLDAVLGSLIDGAIQERAVRLAREEVAGERNFEEKKDLLQIFLDLELPDKEEDHQTSSTNNSNTTIKALLSDFVVGATDTTSTMVEWVMSRLLFHPEMMDKVMEELTRVVGTNQIVEEHHLTELNYLDAVIKETFRLHPPVPLLVAKSASVSTTLCGYAVPKGTKVFVNMWAIQRDPLVWENPLEFRPERFLSGNREETIYDFAGNNFNYLPFGSGRRKCPGLPLAEKMLKYVLASFLHSFDWELPKDTEIDFEDEFGIVIKKSKPLIAIPKPRLSTSSELYM